MEKFFKSDRLRTALLNSSLFLLFACVAAADRWPNLTAPALGLGFAGLVAQAAILRSSARRLALRERPEQAAATIPVTTSVSAASTDIAKALFSDVETFQSFYDRSAHRRHLQIARVRASVLSTWEIARMQEFFTSYLEDQSPSAMRLTTLYDAFILNKHRDLEIAQWEFMPQGDQAFAVKAGAFEIEHFHGRSNIRVLDPTKVTIESTSRGQRSKVHAYDEDCPVTSYQ